MVKKYDTQDHRRCIASAGIQMEPGGRIYIEALQNNAGIKAGGVVQAMLTWPCAFN